MDIRYQTIDEPATSAYVLAVLQDMHRQQCQYDPEADPGAIFSLETTVAEWRDACAFVEWKELARLQNEFWGVSFSDKEWHAVLEPANHKRLSDVCCLIATRVVRPMIRPARLLGTNCAAAGAFLTIRSLLHQAGEGAADKITPSTPVAAYARRYAKEFLGPISRLAPGALPPVRVHDPVYHAAIGGMGVGVLCAMVGLCSGVRLLTAGGFVLSALCYALTWYAAKCLLPASVEFGELRTFRDLALVVAKGRSV
jgi:hypothetical protein